MTSRNFCFTSFNVDHYRVWNGAPNGLKFVVGQLERAPDTGRLHVQGYAVADKAIRITGFKKLLGDDQAHVETRRGSHEEARDYCLKEDSRADDGYFTFNFGTGKQARNLLPVVANAPP